MHALGAGGLRPIRYTLPNGRMAIMGWMPLGIL